MADYIVRAEVEVRITVDEDQAPADLFTRAEDEEGFQRVLYGKAVSDKPSVLRHWAYNAIANGVQSPHRLDGWADLDRDVVHLRVTEVYDFGEPEEATR